MYFLLRRLSNRLLRLPAVFLIVFSAIFIISATMMMYLIEPDTFKNPFNAMWYVMTTLTTVGYGDFYPITVAGKIFAMFLYLFGIGLLSLVIGKIIDLFVHARERRLSGKLNYTNDNQIIIIHWNKKAQSAVDELLSNGSLHDIVIIDDLDKMPLDHPRVHFVSGDPASDDILRKAGIERAQSAIIFGDVRIDDPSLTDGKSLLISSSIERLAPKVHTTVEIMMEKHIKNFRHVNINDFILSHDAVSRLAVRSALHEGSTDIFTQLLSSRFGDDLYEIPCDPAWVTYRHAFNALLSQGATLIANRGDLGINRTLDDKIGPNPKLYVICNPETYAEIIKKGR